MEEKKKERKKILALTAALLLITYVITAATILNRRPDHRVCREIVLTIKDTLTAGFITKREITNLIQGAKLNPVGKNMEAVNTQAIEKTLSKHVLINEVECYKTLGGKLCVEIHQRIPLLRIMSLNGDNYYIDNQGKVMPLHVKCIAHLPVVTGEVTKTFATTELYKLGQYLHNNKIWEAQIEQINVLPKGEIEMVPRVGDHIIFLGNTDQLEKKFERLRLFYLQGLNKVGWNKYSRIDLDFKNQIVCTKSKKV